MSDLGEPWRGHRGRRSRARRPTLTDRPLLASPPRATAFGDPPAQLLAAELAVSRGHDPDAPRGLQKVTHTL